MTALELIALLSTIPGDTVVFACTPNDDDTETFHNIVNHHRALNGMEEFVLVCTPEGFGRTLHVSTKDILGDDPDSV